MTFQLNVAETNIGFRVSDEQRLPELVLAFVGPQVLLHVSSFIVDLKVIVVRTKSNVQ